MEEPKVETPTKTIPSGVIWLGYTVSSSLVVVQIQ